MIATIHHLPQAPPKNLAQEEFEVETAKGFGRWPIGYVWVAPSEPVFQFGEIIDMPTSKTHSQRPATRTTMLNLVAT
jgi:hypothetical protein